MGNRRRGTSRPWWAAAVLAYVTAGVAAHFVPVKLLGDLTVAAYVVAEVGGLSFIVRYARTDWRAHPWGRHVMTFMVCLEILFTLALSRRVFGLWPGLAEVGFLASATFAGIVWWRYKLQRDGDRRAARTPTTAESSATECSTDRTAPHD